MNSIIRRIRIWIEGLRIWRAKIGEEMQIRIIDGREADAGIRNAEGVIMDENTILANKITTCVMGLVYKNCLEALETMLQREGVSSREYTILGMRDDSICLTCSEGSWNVFSIERGQKFDLSVYEDLTSACLAVIRRFSCTYKEEARMKSAFLARISKIKPAEVKVKDVYSIVKEELLNRITGG